ncbi:Hypothetical predicted protein [Mytilus galloprovincialis]|uniref:Integrase zinc-binding domain-containing protein n=1 Tax=Mytilus galloprovincialis TaxID=29158 RepID=A0A8B6EIC7_MYTGA|nr:Hypothetical predicted protein [Mytilus galloprovincialis]
MTVDDYECDVNYSTWSAAVCRVNLKQTVCFSSGNEMLLIEKVKKKERGFQKTGTFLSKPKQRFENHDKVCAAYVLTEGKDLCIIRVMNVSAEDVTMYKNTTVGYILPVKEQKYIGRTDLVRHGINTGNEAAIKQNPKRIPLHKKQEVKELIHDMLEREVIRPSSSPWSSPIVLVEKKDNSTRLCVDFRKLTIDEHVERLIIVFERFRENLVNSYQRHYLLGKKFQVRTDHKALSWLWNFKEPEDQIARWQAYLSEFDMEIVHRKGSNHNNEDGMSRRPYAQLESEERDDGLISDSGFCQARLIGQWENIVPTDGILYRKFEDINETAYQFLVPTKLRRNILETLHSGIGGGHLGTKKMLRKLKDRFYWPGMVQDVEIFCEECRDLCYSEKSCQQHLRAPLVSVKTGALLEK